MLAKRCSVLDVRYSAVYWVSVLDLRYSAVYWVRGTEYRGWAMGIKWGYLEIWVIR